MQQMLFPTTIKLIKYQRKYCWNQCLSFSIYRYDSKVHSGNKHPNRKKGNRQQKSKKAGAFHGGKYQPRFSNNRHTSYQPHGELLYTTNAVLSALRYATQSKRKTMFELYIQDSKLYGDKRTNIDYIDKLARNLQIPIKYETKHTMNNMTMNEKHQGVALDCSELSIPDINLKDLEISSFTSEGKTPLILHFDEFNDPRNFGNVLRTASYFDVDLITFSKKNSCPITPTVAIVSSGAVEELSAKNKLRTISGKLNTPTFLDIASNSYGYNVFGTSLNSKAVNVSKMKLGTTPTILVFGSEGKGLRKQVLDVCTSLYKIPNGHSIHDTTGDHYSKSSSIDSLNVGVSVGICLWQLLSSRA